MNSIQDKVVTRLQRLGRGKVVTPKDFLDLGSRDATDQALHRLVRSGALIRIGRGLYHFPRVNDRLGITVPPGLDDMADALGRQVGSRVAPSGAVAANRLGLSTQIPAVPIYLTDGRSRKVRVGKFQIQLKHVSPKQLPPGSPVSTAVFQALQYLGHDAVDDRVVALLRDRLTPAQRHTLLRDARYASDWMAAIARRIAAGDHASDHGDPHG